MTLREKLEEDIRNAMRSRNQERLGTLRFLKSQIQLVEKDRRKTLDEAGLIEVIAKQVKDRRESLQMFEQGNRPDLVAKESAALAVLQEYLPAQMSREELVAYFDGGGDISELLRDAAVGPDLGPVPNPESVPMIVTGVRLSTAAVQRLDELAGNDKAGRSGLIRQAIDEFLARHTPEAA